MMFAELGICDKRGPMSLPETFEIYLVAMPGLEAVLRDEALQLGFIGAVVVSGGVAFQGGWPDVWRANLQIRGASQVLVRIGSFHVSHLAQLDKLARKFPWGNFLRADVPVRVEASCKKSRIYHAGAAAQRIETALREELGATIDEKAFICVKARIEDNLCTISLETSGESLHKRGHKLGIGKAPMRETMAALFLRQCGFEGTEPVVDPMCGSGTFVIEAAEISASLAPGRDRSFAFEQLSSFDAAAWAKLRKANGVATSAHKFYGSDRDSGVIVMATDNASRAGVASFCEFQNIAVGGLQRPGGQPGLVMVNPPYGTRIGDKKPLHDLYRAFGQVMLTRFSGWRVGLVTSDTALAKSTGLPFLPTGRSVLHGGLRIQLFQTKALP
jgi:putative N6-adenine-specific DNA methylase